MVTLCTAVALASALRAFVLSLLFREPPVSTVFTELKKLEAFSNGERKGACEA